MNGVLVKEGVKFTTVAPAGYCILAALRNTAPFLMGDVMITSACEGEHSGPNDPHHLGEAYDVRSRGLSASEQAQLLFSVQKFLERQWPGKFYGFLEAEGTNNEHFHFQRRKDTIFTIEDYLNGKV